VRLAVFTSQFPGHVNTFFARDMRALIDAGIDLEIFAIYPRNDELWQFVPEILSERVLSRDRVHHLRLRDCLRNVQATTAGRLSRFARDSAALASAASWFGPMPMTKSAYVALKAWEWAARYPDGFDHVLGYWGNYAGSCAYLFHRLTSPEVPFSLFLHAGTDLYRTPIYLRQKLLYADAIVTCIEFNRRFLREHYLEVFKQLEPKIHVCYHGLDLTEFPYRPEGRPPARLIAVGTLSKAKGFDDLLRAVAELDRRGLPDVEVDLIGGGQEEARLRALARQLELSAQVHFRGHLRFDQVRAAMTRATVLVHPSSALGDGLPNVIKEAMALGTPVVASNIAGIAEGLDDGACGMLVPPRNVPLLADALQRLLGDPALCRSYADAARKHVEDQFDLRKTGPRLAEILKATRRRPSEPVMAAKEVVG